MTVGSSDMTREACPASKLLSSTANANHHEPSTETHPSQAESAPLHTTDTAQGLTSRGPSEGVTSRGPSQEPANHDPQQGSSRSLRGTSRDSSESLTQDRVSSRSRSVTPTPAISIEPDVGLEWTADMLSLKESEVVTSDTSLAKARGSNTTTTSSVTCPSDDESLEGDNVFGDDTPDEGGEVEVEEREETVQTSHASKSPTGETSAAVTGTVSDNVSRHVHVHVLANLTVAFLGRAHVWCNRPHVWCNRPSVEFSASQ